MSLTPHVHAHLFRHSIAVHLLRNGTDIPCSDVKRDCSFTIQYYYDKKKSENCEALLVEEKSKEGETVYICSICSTRAGSPCLYAPCTGYILVYVAGAGFGIDSVVNAYRKRPAISSNKAIETANHFWFSRHSKVISFDSDGKTRDSFIFDPSYRCCTDVESSRGWPFIAWFKRKYQEPRWLWGAIMVDVAVSFATVVLAGIISEFVYRYTNGRKNHSMISTLPRSSVDNEGN